MDSRKPATIFNFIERDYKSIILEIRDQDSTGMSSSMSYHRKTILFVDNTRMYVTERIVNGEILFYQYDWHSDTGEEILKFHSEEHKDKRYKTETGDHHIHPSALVKVHNIDRLPNYHHQDLHSIMEAIRLHMLAIQAIGKTKRKHT